MGINDALPLKAARLDATAKLKSSGGFDSKLQTNPMPFRVESPWDVTLMPLRACAMNWGRNRILKNSGPILCRFWTKVREFFDDVGDRL